MTRIQHKYFMPVYTSNIPIELNWLIFSLSQYFSMTTLPSVTVPARCLACLKEPPAPYSAEPVIWLFLEEWLPTELHIKGWRDEMYSFQVVLHKRQTFTFHITISLISNSSILVKIFS